MELFKNPHDALMFALRFSAQQYAQTPLAKEMRRAAMGPGGGAIGQGKGLVGLDGAAQAGIICARLDRLTPLQRACILARFSERVESCHCCGSDKMLDAYKGALLTLANWAGTYANSDKVGQRLLFSIVQEFFDRPKKMAREAEKLGVPKRTAYDQKARIWPHLVELDKAAMQAAGDVLEDLIGEVN